MMSIVVNAYVSSIKVVEPAPYIDEGSYVKETDVMVSGIEELERGIE